MKQILWLVHSFVPSIKGEGKENKQVLTSSSLPKSPQMSPVPTPGCQTFQEFQWKAEIPQEISKVADISGKRQICQLNPTCPGGYEGYYAFHSIKLSRFVGKNKLCRKYQMGWRPLQPMKNYKSPSFSGWVVVSFVNHFGYENHYKTSYFQKDLKT